MMLHEGREGQEMPTAPSVQHVSPAVSSQSSILPVSLMSPSHTHAQSLLC